MTKTCLGSDPESEVCFRKAGSYPKLKPRAPGCSFPFFSAAKTAVTLSYSFHPLRAKTIYTIPAAKGREVCDVLHTPSKADFRVIAVVAAQDDPQADIVQLESTLYGVVDIIYDQDEIGNALAKDCFYFTFSEFYRLTDIVGVLAFADPMTSRLYLNSFALDLHTFRKSKLYSMYAEENAVEDPLAAEQRGNIFVADCALDRRD